MNTLLMTTMVSNEVLLKQFVAKQKFWRIWFALRWQVKEREKEEKTQVEQNEKKIRTGFSSKIIGFQSSFSVRLGVFSCTSEN